MALKNVKGFNYIDFIPSKKFNQLEIEKRDLCNRLNEAIKDEIQATMDYKGMVTHYYSRLSPNARKEIIEISNDETDHRSKFELIKKEVGC